jgi:ankyrin repeat protein
MEDDLDGDLREEQGSREAEGKDDDVDDDVVEADDAGSGSGSEDEEEEDDDDDEAAAETVLAVAISRERPLAEIRAIVEAHPELLRQRDEYGSLPIHAAFNDNFDETAYVLGLVQCFLREWPESAREHTMEVNGGGIERSLPLHLACEYYCLALHGTDDEEGVQRGKRDKAEMVRLLVEAYPEAVREKRHDGKMPLDLALEHLPSLGSVRAIVRAWPDAIEASYNNGTLLLHEAVDHGASEDVLQYLIEQRPASLQQLDKNRKTALHRQGKETRLGAVTYVANRWEGALQAQDQWGRVPLHYAAADGSQEDEPNRDCVDIVRFLVEKCPETALVADHKGKIPLHIAAACRGEAELVDFLLQASPESARIKDNKGFLPLHCAASEWEGVEKARRLVEHWPDSIRERTNEGWLPLHEATHAGSLPCVNYFCETWPGAVNEPSHHGWLPIHSALVCNDAEQSTLAMAGFLIGNNPDMLTRATDEGYLPLHVALGRDNCEGTHCPGPDAPGVLGHDPASAVDTPRRARADPASRSARPGHPSGRVSRGPVSNEVRENGRLRPLPASAVRPQPSARHARLPAAAHGGGEDPTVGGNGAVLCRSGSRVRRRCRR